MQGDQIKRMYAIFSLSPGISFLSIALTGIVLGNAYYTKKQFYPSVVYITKSNPSMAVSTKSQIILFSIVLTNSLPVPIPGDLLPVHGICADDGKTNEEDLPGHAAGHRV